MDHRDVIEARLAAIYGGHKWIIAVEAAAIATEAVARLRNRGAADVMVVAAVAGVGDLPDCEIRLTHASGTTIMQGLRSFEQSLLRPSQDVAEAVAQFDPDGEARVLQAGFGTLAAALGRPVYGVRPATQAALEDKMLADGLWDAARIPRAPTTIVKPEDGPVAHRRIAGPKGSVWVADNKEGWHGGGEYVRWVADDADAAAAAVWFTQHSDRVRVMPFLDGIPCSVHGWVTGNGIAVGEPMEMLILRRVDRPAFVYAGMATFWNPEREAADAMRSAALAVGHDLVERVGYIGPYGIDGVLTAEGFRPTELNPRLSAGHSIPARAAGLAPFDLATTSVAGDLDLDAQWLERVVRAATTEQRGGRASYHGHPVPLPERSIGVCFTEHGAVAASDATKQATIETGASPSGGLVFVAFEPDRIAVGPSVAGLAVAGLRFAAEEFDLDVPELEAAPDLWATAVPGG